MSMEVLFRSLHAAAAAALARGVEFDTLERTLGRVAITLYDLPGAPTPAPAFDEDASSESPIRDPALSSTSTSSAAAPAGGAARGLVNGTTARMRSSSSLPEISPGKPAATSYLYEPPRRGLDVWGRPLPLPPAPSPMAKSSLMEVRRADRLLRSNKQQTGLVAVSPMPAISAGGPTRTSPQHGGGGGGRGGPAADSIGSPTRPSLDASGGDNNVKNGEEESVKGAEGNRGAGNGFAGDGGGNGGGNGGGAGLLTRSSSTTAAAVHGITTSDTDATAGAAASSFSASSSSAATTGTAGARRRWQETKDVVVVEERSRKPRAMRLLDQAAKRFNASADARRQGGRAAAHLIGALRERAAGSDPPGRLDRDAFYELLETTPGASAIVDVIHSSEPDDFFGSIDRSARRNAAIAIHDIEAAIREVVEPKALAVIDELLARGNDVMDTSVKQMQGDLGGQAARVIDLFKKWDKNGDGTISRPEFFRAMPVLGMVGNTAEEVDALFAAFDPSGDGEISFRELYRAIKRATYTGYGAVEEPKPARVQTTEELVDLNELRKDIGTSLLQMELRHEVLLGGRRSLKDSHDGMPGRRRPIDRALLPAIKGVFS